MCAAERRSDATLLLMHRVLLDYSVRWFQNASCAMLCERIEMSMHMNGVGFSKISELNEAF